MHEKFLGGRRSRGNGSCFQSGWRVATEEYPASMDPRRSTTRAENMELRPRGFDAMTRGQASISEKIPLLALNAPIKTTWFFERTGAGVSNGTKIELYKMAGASGRGPKSCCVFLWAA
jgi:hypothetical protein